MTDLRFIDRDSEEWERMWSGLACNVDLERTNHGERWEYMGTVLHRTAGSRTVRGHHEFRHRAYTLDDHGAERRHYVNVQASFRYVYDEAKT